MQSKKILTTLSVWLLVLSTFVFVAASYAHHIVNASTDAGVAFIPPILYIAYAEAEVSAPSSASGWYSVWAEVYGNRDYDSGSYMGALYKDAYKSAVWYIGIPYYKAAYINTDGDSDSA